MLPSAKHTRLPKVNTAKKYYNYAWRYPVGYILPDGRDGSNAVFYVGKGTGQRAVSHLTEARGRCICYKCQIIRDIWRSGKEPILDILYETDIEINALLYEWACMHYIHVGPFLINQEALPSRSRPKGYSYLPTRQL